ncbi:MAG: hypothetical protein WD557_04870 [Dehalococcoidia bacterium]
MDTLRRQRVGRKVSLQTPVIRLERRDGRRGVLVLTAHLGEARYFEELALTLDGHPNVFFEAVRAVDEAPEHWRDSHHRFLRDLREVYAGIAGLGLLEYQGKALAPRESWVSADVTCCELAAKLRQERVGLWRQEAAMKALREIVGRAQGGDERAGRAIVLALQWGLLAASVTAIFNLISWLPTTRALYRVLNDWRSEQAVRVVWEANVPDFALVYGAAHGESLLRELRKAGYREVEREWHTVFTL